MINTRMTAALAAAALAIGVLVGSAGTIVLRVATAPQAGDWTAQMSQVRSTTGATGMMGGGYGMMGGHLPMGSASAMPDWMRSHHPAVSPVPAQ